MRALNLEFGRGFRTRPREAPFRTRTDKILESYNAIAPHSLPTSALSAALTSASIKPLR